MISSRPPHVGHTGDGSSSLISACTARTAGEKRRAVTGAQRVRTPHRARFARPVRRLAATRPVAVDAAGAIGVEHRCAARPAADSSPSANANADGPPPADRAAERAGARARPLSRRRNPGSSGARAGSAMRSSIGAAKERQIARCRTRRPSTRRRAACAIAVARSTTCRQHGARVGGAQLHLRVDEHHAKRRRHGKTHEDERLDRADEHDPAEECRREVVEVSAGDALLGDECREQQLDRRRAASRAAR